MQRTDFPLSRESKLHFSPEGFLQIPLGDVKELYAIKFKDKVDGETFYGKVVGQMGMCYQCMQGVYVRWEGGEDLIQI